MDVQGRATFLPAIGHAQPGNAVEAATSASISAGFVSQVKFRHSCGPSFLGVAAPLIFRCWAGHNEI